VNPIGITDHDGNPGMIAVDSPRHVNADERVQVKIDLVECRMLRGSHLREPKLRCARLHHSIHVNLSDDNSASPSNR